jgi:hypothetical protein
MAALLAGVVAGIHALKLGTDALQITDSCLDGRTHRDANDSNIGKLSDPERSRRVRRSVVRRFDHLGVWREK